MFIKISTRDIAFMTERIRRFEGMCEVILFAAVPSRRLPSSGEQNFFGKDNQENLLASELETFKREIDFQKHREAAHHKRGEDSKAVKKYRFRHSSAFQIVLLVNLIVIVIPLLWASIPDPIDLGCVRMEICHELQLL